jgi:hypothetical protein
MNIIIIKIYLNVFFKLILKISIIKRIKDLVIYIIYYEFL